MTLFQSSPQAPRGETIKDIQVLDSEGSDTDMEVRVITNEGSVMIIRFSPCVVGYDWDYVTLSNTITNIKKG